VTHARRDSHFDQPRRTPACEVIDRQLAAAQRDFDPTAELQMSQHQLDGGFRRQGHDPFLSCHPNVARLFPLEVDRQLLGRMDGGVEKDVIPSHRFRERQRLERIRDVVEKSEVENDVERAAQRLGNESPRPNSYA